MNRVDVEIRAMMMLQHPHVARLENVMESDDHVFFIMELCGGGNLNEFMGGTPLSENQVRVYRCIASQVELLIALALTHLEIS